MKIKPIFLAALAAVTVTSAHAQGVQRGAERGAREGAHEAGPVGAVVGGAVGAVGAVVGGVNGLLGVEDRPRFRKYVKEQDRPSYRYNGPVAVGTTLPEQGVDYYEVPEDYRVMRYRYTVIDGTAVLVDPETRMIVEVID